MNGDCEALSDSSAGSTNCTFKDLILNVNNANSSGYIATVNAGVCANLLMIRNGTANGNGVKVQGSMTFVGCACVRPSDKTAAGTAYHRNAGTPILQSCGSFGYTTASDTGWDGTNSKNNATEQSSIAGISNQVSVSFTSATPFTNALNASQDWRAIAATALAGNGLLDATNAPNDISAFVRGSSPTIGAWELAGAAAVFQPLSREFAFLT